MSGSAPAFQQLLMAARRQWILESSARRLLFIAAWTFNGLLLVLLLKRILHFPAAVMLVIPAGALLAALWTIRDAWKKAPSGLLLLQLLDERAGTGDLFASAAEFAENPGRFGWMGLLTCSQASAVKENVKLRSAWRWGPRQYWKACLVTVAVLIPLQLALTFIKTSREKEMATEIAVIKKLGGGQAARDAKQEALAPDEKANAKPAAAKKGDLEADDFQAPPQEKAPEQVVKITDDMVDKYMQSIPEQKEIDLSNVSVAKWDEDEVSGKTNPQNTRKPEDKIDPVKLDPTMLKDLESAKKTLQKDEGETGKKEGVDVAVQGKEAEGPKSSAGGDKKKDPGQLAGAISKDPRGTPSRITSKLDKNGLSIVSSARLQTQKPGQQRPLDPLEFYAGIKRAQAKPAAVEASGGQGGKAENRGVWQEGVPDADRDLVDQYFMKLRKEDR